MNIIKELKQNKKTVILSMVLAFVFTYGSAIYSQKTQNDIAEGVLRFHIIANSNSYNDQRIKLKIRDSVLKEINPLTETSNSKEETIYILNENLDLIQQVAEKIIEQETLNYTVSASIEKTYFPKKEYGDLNFPAGEYDALRIQLGEAEGENFWCVVFPSLCFVDESFTEVEAKTKNTLEAVLTKEGYSIVVESEDEVVPEFKFKVVEFWQELGKK
ncbi:MAG: stage II sporulation protein R [Anaerotignaceae bacterium]